MKEKGRKMAGGLIALAGVLVLIMGIGEETFSTILMVFVFVLTVVYIF